MTKLLRHYPSRCGGGKTQDTIKSLHKLLTNNPQVRYIFASKTNNLSKQSQKDFLALNTKEEHVECIRIDSNSNNVGSELTQLLEDNVSGALFVSHAALLTIDPTLLSNAHVIFDEVPSSLCGPISVSYNKADGVAPWEERYIDKQSCDHQGYLRATLKPLVDIKALQEYIADIRLGKNNRDTEAVADILELLVNGQEVVYTTVSTTSDGVLAIYQGVTWLSVKNIFDNAKAVTVLAAEIEQTLFGFLAKNLLGMTISSNGYAASSIQTKHKHKVRIYPLLSAGSWSKTLKLSEASESLTLNGNPITSTGSVFDVAQSFVKSVMGDDEFVYTLNAKTDSISSELQNQAHRTSTAVHGMNHLRNIDHAAFLAATHPDPMTLKSLAHLAKDNGLDGEELKRVIFTERMYEPAYQAVARCSIRNHEVKDIEHKLIVPDMEFAKYLASWFEGDCAVIDTSMSYQRAKPKRAEEAYYKRRDIAVAILTDKKNKVAKVKDLLIKYGITQPTFARYKKEHKEHLQQLDLVK